MFYLFLTALVAGLIFLYKNFDPATNAIFPACPFNLLTGYLCPGCGSQRAVHHLLNLNIGEAFFLNPLLLISLPYILLGIILDNISLSEKLLRLRKALFGPAAMRLILAVIILYWIGRNLLPRL